MFGTQTRLFAVAAVVLLCAATVLSESYFYVAEFTEQYPGGENAYLKGTLYYYYNSEDLLKSRLRFNYELPIQDDQPTYVGNLYDYEQGAMYSQCGTCTGTPIGDLPDPWFFDASYYGSTSTTESSGTWYQRKDFMPTGFVDKGYNPQVSRILLKSATAKDASNIVKIEFNDGRIVIFNKTDVTTPIDSSSSVFQLDAGCDSPGCNVKADVVFVLDSSVSVSDTEWSAQASFVSDMVRNGFTMSSQNGVMAAVVQFNGPMKGTSHCGQSADNVCPKGYGPTDRNCAKYDCCDGQGRSPDGFDHWCYRCTRNMDTYTYNENDIPKENTASVLGKAYQPLDSQNQMILNGGVLTASADDVAANAASRGIRTGYNDGQPGSTCQYYGLALARRILKHSKRGDGVQKIIIAVTDGADKCPYKTEEIAKTIRDVDKYLLIEISVGLNSCNDYDKKYLSGLASNFGGRHYYFNTSDYDDLKNNLKEALYKPFCQAFGTPCDEKCKGWCGCGRCFCPDCTDTGKFCYSNKCNLHTSSGIIQSNGCERVDVDCGVDTKCNAYVCNEGPDDSNRCTVLTDGYGNDKCKEMRAKTRDRMCMNVVCKEQYENACKIEYNDNFCQERFGDTKRGCEIYKCANVDASTSSFGWYDDETGCYFAENVTKQCEDDLVASGKKNCFDASCSNGVCVPVDKCPGENPNSNCYDNECKNVNGQWKCVQSDNELRRTVYVDDQCTQYTCKPNGWEGHTEWYNTTCRNYFKNEKHHDVRCKSYECVWNHMQDHGCVETVDEGCTTDCPEEGPVTLDSCKGDGYAKSTNVSCTRTTCKTNSELEPYCEDVETHNCMVELAEEVATRNSEQSDYCYTPMCQNSKCVAYRQNKVGQVINECMTVECVKQDDGSWIWVPVQTEQAASCYTDNCYSRMCDPSFGCIETDLCAALDNDCERYECVDQECVPVSLLITNSTCITEVCKQEGGRYVKDFEQKDLTIACPLSLVNNDLCKEPTCVVDPDTLQSECVFVDKEPPAICKNKCYECSCDPTTGVFSTPYKCTDGDGCTIDGCDIDGVCNFDMLIDCDLIIDMSAFPCFKAECRSDPTDERGFKCMRTLLPNSYIDVCGECIVESTGAEEEQSSLQSQQSGAVLTDCTGAPAKPLLTEGLAAASIALIILAAVVIGAGIAASSVIGTKTLIDRAKGANNQSAHSNPLFEETETEMTNPAFVGE